MHYLKTGEKFRDGKEPCPGSTRYYLENRRERVLYKKDISDEQLNELNDYLPRAFKNYKCGKNPDTIVADLGWKYNKEQKKFHHDKYTKSDGSPKYFDVGFLTWNDERYMVPVNSDSFLDNLGITWSYKNVSTIWVLERNNPLDYWKTRKGKRMAKYIEYRKRREKRAQMYSTAK